MSCRNFFPIFSRRGARLASLAVLLAGVWLPLRAADHDHVVSRAELQQALQSAQHERQSHLRDVREFLAAPAVRQALVDAKLDPVKIDRVVPLLSADEVARLALRARQANSGVTGGALSNEHLTYIVIALATAVIVLIAV